MKQEGYQPRDYRRWIHLSPSPSFTVTVKETDLYIRAAENLRRKAYRLVLKYRSQLEKYIAANPAFATSLEPLPIPSHAPRLVISMLEAGKLAGVGPMAAVAGAIAEYVGKELLSWSPGILVENGGDIFMKAVEKTVVGLYAGDSPFTGRLGLEIMPEKTPLGVCTSSGTVGHSLSFGKADAVVVTSPSTPLADAAATAICNRVKTISDIEKALQFGRTIPGVTGILIVIGTEIGAWGDISLCETTVNPYITALR